MAFDVNNPYFRTKVLTASPEQLRLMLIDGGIHFMELGRDALAKKDFEGVYENISQAKAILLELINALRPEHAPDLCERLSSLYTFMFTELTRASTERSPEVVDKVIELMRFERETWVMLMEKVAKERDAEQAAPTNPLPEVTTRSVEGDTARPTLSVQG
ncbi:MAG: flagellar export chaperone FliS [Planctomycetota bacterium]